MAVGLPGLRPSIQSGREAEKTMLKQVFELEVVGEVEPVSTTKTNFKNPSGENCKILTLSRP